MRKPNAIFVILFQLFLIGLVVQKIEAQSAFVYRKYSICFRNESLDTVVNKLQRLTTLGFSYNPEILENHYRISHVFNDQSLKTILDTILIPNRLTYQIIGQNIAIAVSRKNPEYSEKTETQEKKSFFPYYGRIVESGTNTPISFANVYIKSKNIGIISNVDGYFILKIPTENLSDSLYFSCLGYKPVSQKITNLSTDQNLILMEPVSVLINEVVVKYIDPNKLLKEAIGNIPRNYSQKAVMNTAFYRETVRENNSYVSLSEAVLHIYKAAYSSYLNDQIAIFKSRRSPFVKQMDTLFFKFQGGLYTSLLLDIAKNPSNFLSDEYMEYYDFKLDEITNIQDRATFVIAFDQKDNAPFPLYKGKIYIDRNTLAIVRADFMISPKGIDKAADELVKKSPRKVKVKPLSVKYLVNYKEHNSIWILSNIHEELVFKVHKKLTFFTRTYNTVADLVITETDTTDVHRFRIRETVHPDDVFVEKIGSYDENFWGDYNFIKPDESLEEALSRVELKIKSLTSSKK